MSSDKPEDMIRLVEKYPEFKECYHDIIEFRRKPEELINMFSDALIQMDKNTVQYMVEEQQKELEKSAEELEKSAEELEKSQKELEKSHKELEKNQKELEKNQKELEKSQKEVENKDKQLAEKDAIIAALQEELRKNKE